MKLIPLEIGRLDTDMRAITGEEGSMVLPVPAWLIDHPDGLALFDTGMHTDLQHGTERIGDFVGSIFRPDFGEGEQISARLEARGIRPSDIDKVVFSHLHFDHAGGTVEIPDARVVIQRAEWEAGHDNKFVDAGIYNPDDYDHGHDVQLVEGEHDVFGDGRVVCIPTPGHTPGHQALRVELDSGPVVLTADCVYFERMLTEMLVPPFGNEVSQEQQRASMRHLASLRDDHGCHLLFGHDEAQFRAIPTDGLS